MVNTWLPYGDLFTKFHRHVGLDLDEEVLVESCTKIRKNILNLMLIKDQGGVLVIIAPPKSAKQASQYFQSTPH